MVKPRVVIGNAPVVTWVKKDVAEEVIVIAPVVILGIVVMVVPRVVIVNAPIVQPVFVVSPRIVIENEPIVTPVWVVMNNVPKY